MSRQNVTLAIYPDATSNGGRRMSFSERWAELAAAEGHNVRMLDPKRADLVEQIRGADGFMWRFHRPERQRLYAKRFVPAVNYGLGIPVYPDVVTCWYYDDKIAMHYALRAAGIPVPRTWVFWSRKDAFEFSRTASYPLVLKLAVGYGSNNVRLVRDHTELNDWIEFMFTGGLFTLERPYSPRELARRILPILPRRLIRRVAPKVRWASDLQSQYLLVQQFVPGNDYDTRVTVIGNRAFAFRRFNRPGDFRASGSGRFDHDVTQIKEDAVRLAFRAARRLRLQAVAVDVLRQNDEPLLVEIGYDYVNWVVNECSGHWVLHGAPESGALQWRDGAVRSEDAILEDFLANIRAEGA